VEAIFVLLPLALLIAAIAVGFFIWAARTGQFDDLETPAVRILFDDEEPRGPVIRTASSLVGRSLGDGGDPTRRVSE
jgi:cbb3-type cytochrome oxidase maturation protein